MKKPLSLVAPRYTNCGTAVVVIRPKQEWTQTPSAAADFLLPAVLEVEGAEPVVFSLERARLIGWRAWRGEG
jgi:hypothetical protein